MGLLYEAVLKLGWILFSLFSFIYTCSLLFSLKKDMFF